VSSAHRGPRDPNSVIILDSCEHLVERARSWRQAAAKLSKLTLVAPAANVGGSGELIWRTPSLSFPASGTRGGRH